jgi:hypothetical protein
MSMAKLPIAKNVLGYIADWQNVNNQIVDCHNVDFQFVTIKMPASKLST